MARFPKFTESRNIRVFVSSTFQDMKGERDRLLKKVFPKLRKIASEHNVTVTEVDLRWGITEEEANSKKVLELCLKEIDNSIPFFIGIVGDRYGWCPSENDVTQYCLESYKDVRKYLDMKLSVTEMEIQYGVLEREEDVHASFYIKKSNRKRNTENSDKLEHLKQSIKDQQRYTVCEYASLDELADQVIMNFVDLIHELFPEQNLPNYTKQIISQEYVVSYLNQSYVPVQSYYDSIETWVSKDGSPFMVIHGESGMGKSALLAGWINSVYEDETIENDLHYYFTNNSKFMNSSAEILYYIYNSLLISNNYDLDDSPSVGSDGLCGLIVDVLKSESYDHFPVIIIDGVDQLYRDELNDLVGALHLISKYSKIIVSTKNLDVIPELVIAENVEYLEVIPLLEKDKRELIIQYLSLYGKKMTDAQINMIATDSQCDNTLVLRSLLDELLTFGVTEKLTDRIEYYLSDDERGFYDCLLDRYEDDFGEELTRKLLCLIYFSKNGLTEVELKSIAKVRNLEFSEFITSFGHQLICKDGKLSFSHNRISSAVFDRYIANDIECESKYRGLLFRGFSRLKSERAYAEIAWQLYMQGDHKKLYKFISRYEVVDTLPYIDFHLFVKYWIFLTQKGYSFSDYLTDEQCRRNDDLLQYLSDIALIYLNNDQAATQFRNQITDNFNERGKFAYDFVKNLLNETAMEDAEVFPSEPFNPNALCNEAELECRKGNYADASYLYHKAIDLILERMEDYPEDMSLRVAEIDVTIKYADVQDAMCKKEYALKAYNRAYDRLRKLKSIDPEIDLTPEEIRILSNIGITIRRDDPYKALEYLNSALELQKARGLNTTTSVSLLMNIGVVYDEFLGLDLKGLEFYHMALDIQMSLTGETNIKVARLYKNISAASRDKKAKFVAFNKSREIYEALGAKLELADLYYAMAAEYSNTAYYNKAVKAYMKCVQLRAEKLGKNDPSVCEVMGDVMEILTLFRQLGVTKNEDPDLFDTEILIAASQVGHHIAEYELAVRLFQGEHIYEDIDTAIAFLKSSAEKGYLPACKMLSDLYRNGVHVQTDYQKALEYLSPFADCGDYEVEYCMGLCFENGYGVQIDNEKAIEWYHKSADKGYAYAYEPLARLLCQRGSYKDALIWARLSVNKFDDDWKCAKTLAMVYKNLSQLEHALNYYKVCKELQEIHSDSIDAILLTESEIDAVMAQLSSR